MLKNQQPIEKAVRSTDGYSLDVHSIFHTIQGEGPFCGTPAVFVRLAGCNLQCPLCDTEYTQGRKMMSIKDIVAEVKWWTEGTKTQLVVITGGEPFRQPLGGLLRQLGRDGFYVQVETNGTLPPSIDVEYNRTASVRHGVYIVCSPKAGKVHPGIERAACCYKYVLQAGDQAEDDGLPLHALGHSANPRLARPPQGYIYPVYLQPADEQDAERNKANTDAAIAACMAHGYILQLQVHKIINLP